MTLIELLVVIVLVTTLVTTAIPILSPGGDSRKIREASRSVNAMLSGAQVRAIATGRPHGVAFKRLSADTRDPEDNGVCVQMYPVEVPPPYAGFDTSSRVMMCRRPTQIGLGFAEYTEAAGNQLAAVDTTAVEYQLMFVAELESNPGESNTVGLPPGWRHDLVPDRFLKPGDLIQVDGANYALVQVGQGTDVTALDGEAQVADDGDGEFFEGNLTRTSQGRRIYVVRPIASRQADLSPAYTDNGSVLPPPEAILAQDGLSASDPSEFSIEVNGVPFTYDLPLWTEPTRFSISRQPAPAAGDPVQLPAGAAIDLQASGFANGAPLYLPSGVWNNVDGADEPGLVTEPVLVMFSPEGSLSRVTLPNYSVQPAQQQETLAVSSLSLLVGRRELIPAQEQEDGVPASYGPEPRQPEDQPLVIDATQPVEDETSEEWRDTYTWLDLNSRWVVVDAQSGSIATLPNSFVRLNNPAQLDRDDDNWIDLQEQLDAAREAVALRTSGGGR